MKKTTAKRIITGILSVITIASSALLLAGCGEKSPKEKIRDAYNDYKNSSTQSYKEKFSAAYNGYKNSSAKSYEEEFEDEYDDEYDDYEISSTETSVEKETVELNLVDNIVSDKLYTLRFNTDENNKGFYIRLYDTIYIDGYTVECCEKEDAVRADRGQTQG